MQWIVLTHEKSTLDHKAALGISWDNNVVMILLYVLGTHLEKLLG